MGGFGSGRYYRYSSRTTTDDVKSIDIGFFRRSGCLPRSWPDFGGTRLLGSLSWTRHEQETGSVGYEISYNALVLSFSHRRGSDCWQDVNQAIRFDRTRCNYGGVRLWFRCPHCSSRIAVIYLGNDGFLCRHCYRLPYTSQHESLADRMMRKARKIRKRLEASNNLFEPVWYKPKGMHWKTYERLHERERKCNHLCMLIPLQQFQAAEKRTTTRKGSSQI